MKSRSLKNCISFLIAAVWVINGLYCKVLNMVPRHQLIIANILGNNYASQFTKIIGSLEIMLAIWIISGIKTRLCAVIQILLILSMNIIEFVLTPYILLFGKFNIVVALFFCCLVYINEFGVNRPIKTTA
jgi:hypothetical protein